MKKNPSKYFKYFKYIELTFFSIVVLNIQAFGDFQIQSRPDWLQPFRQCWASPLENISGDKIASDNVKVFIPTSFGKIEAVEWSTGKTLWQIELGGETGSKISSDEKNIFLINESGAGETGQTIELSETPAATRTGNTNESSATTENTALNASLRSLDSSTGITIWKKNIAGSPKTSLHINEKRLLLIGDDGKISALNKEDGVLIWETNLNRKILSRIVFAGGIVLGTTDRLLFVSLNDGKTFKELVVKEGATSLTVDEEKIFWADGRNFLNGTRISTGNIVWRRRFGAGISDVTSTSKGVLVSSIDNFVYFLNKNNGKILWKRRLAARVSEKPFIRKEIAVIFPFGESTALFIELNKGRVVNSISLSDANYFTGVPTEIGDLLIFPTLKGLYAFGAVCPPMEKTGL